MDDEKRFLGVLVWQWDGIAGLVSLCGLIVIVTTAGFGFYELSVRNEASRAQATLDLLNVWDGGGYLKRYRDLSAKFDSIIREAPPLEIDAARDNLAIRAKLIERVTERVLEAPDERDSFEALAYFFQRVHVCVESKLCAEAATSQFFGEFMLSFGRTFATEISKRRRSDPNFARGIVDQPADNSTARDMD